MSNDAPIHQCESEINHYTGHYVPYSLRRVCGFFNVPQIYYMCKGLWDGAYGLSSLSEKTRKSNRLQMLLQRQQFLLCYLKNLSVGPAEVASSRSADRRLSHWANRAAVEGSQNIIVSGIRFMIAKKKCCGTLATSNNLRHWFEDATSLILAI